MAKNLDTLDSQDEVLTTQLKKDADTFRKESLHPDANQYMELLDTRIQIRPKFREKLIDQLKSAFGYHYDYHCKGVWGHLKPIRLLYLHF